MFSHHLHVALKWLTPSLLAVITEAEEVVLLDPFNGKEMERKEMKALSLCHLKIPIGPFSFSHFPSLPLPSLPSLPSLSSLSFPPLPPFSLYLPLTLV